MAPPTRLPPPLCLHHSASAAPPPRLSIRNCASATACPSPRTCRCHFASTTPAPPRQEHRHAARHRRSATAAAYPQLRLRQCASASADLSPPLRFHHSPPATTMTPGHSHAKACRHTLPHQGRRFVAVPRTLARGHAKARPAHPHRRNTNTPRPLASRYNKATGRLQQLRHRHADMRMSLGRRATTFSTVAKLT